MHCEVTLLGFTLLTFDMNCFPIPDVVRKCDGDVVYLRCIEKKGVSRSYQRFKKRWTRVLGQRCQHLLKCRTEETYESMYLREIQLNF